MKDIKHIFFDLDHTLWDYESNSRKTLNDIYNQFQLADHSEVTFDGFLANFYLVNNELWHQYNIGAIGREDIRQKRFQKVLEISSYSSQTDISEEISHYFLFQCPRQGKIISDADMILSYLSKRYGLSVVTNGFDDVQTIKLKSSGLDKFFQHVFTSETTGHKKPSPEIFYHALEQIGLDAKEVIMIGDNPNTDILGARNANITPIFFNTTGARKSACELQITHLSELLKIL